MDLTESDGWTFKYNLKTMRFPRSRQQGLIVGSSTAPRYLCGLKGQPASGRTGGEWRRRRGFGPYVQEEDVMKMDSSCWLSAGEDGEQWALFKRDRTSICASEAR